MGYWSEIIKDIDEFMDDFSSHHSLPKKVSRVIFLPVALIFNLAVILFILRRGFGIRFYHRKKKKGK